MRTFILPLVLLFAVSPFACAAEESPNLIGPLDVIKYKDSSFEMVGHVVAEDDDSVTIVPKNGGRLDVKRELIDEILYDAEEPPQISTEELVDGFTSHIMELVEKAKSFQLAKVAANAIYLNIGEGRAVRPGLEASVYREGEEIVDPVTGQILGREKDLVGVIQIIGVEEAYSKALPVDTPIADFREGDIGVFLRERPALAVADITTLDGRRSPYGTLLSEEIAAKLNTSPDLIILERAQLGQVIRELAKQNAMLGHVPEGETVAETRERLAASGTSQSPTAAVLDESMVEKMSMLEGADALLVGTVAAVKGGASVNIRIVHTSTGAVLYSTQNLVREPEKPIRMLSKKKPQKPKKRPEPAVDTATPAEEGNPSGWQKGDALDRILRAIYER